VRDPLALTLLLSAAALLRTGCAGVSAGGDDFERLTRDAPPLPDLARDGVQRLSWLPGVGVGRARGIVEQRPFLARPLEATTLPELPGVGEQTAAAVRRWYLELEALDNLELEAPGNPPRRD